MMRKDIMLKLLMYKKNNCGHCDILIQNLSKWGIQFHVINIDNNDIAKDFLKKANKKTVPQLFLNSFCINGDKNADELTREFIISQIGEHALKFYVNQSV